ncbi:MAG: hypothetical protein ACYC54_15820, partial [Sedimentisphaerales bacterium]
IEGPNSKYINYTIWNDGRNAKMYLINIDWQHKQNKKIIIRNGNKQKSVSVPGGKMLTINL